MTAVLLLSAVAILFIRSLPDSSGTVTVTVDGKHFGCWSLSEDKRIEINSPFGTNSLLIFDGTASITEADCPDLICAHHVPISHTGERIVCLPNRVIVSIDTQADNTSSDALAQ